MVKRWYGWALFLLISFLNLRYFLSRWAEAPLNGLPEPFSVREISSSALGLGLAAALLSMLEQLRRRRGIAALMIPLVVAPSIWACVSLKCFSDIFPPIQNFVVAGAVLGVLCLRLRESNSELEGSQGLCSFWHFTLASFNFFLLVAPFTNLVPSYTQDSVNPLPSLHGFYYGSVHSDISPISVLFRAVINFFFIDPSINATAITSMVLVSLGLGFGALATQYMFGTVWGWLFLMTAWTDRWILSSAVASSIIGMPVLSTAMVLFLCVWALTRRAGLLSWKETWLLAALNGLGVVYNLYAYSAARMPWIAGSLITAGILLHRRAVRPDLDGLKKGITAIAPAIIALVAIWFFIFDRDTTLFKSQIFISPKPASIIKDINDYPHKLIAINDNDVPIWWGTGRPETINVNLYWPRTPREIFDKMAWFMGELALGVPMAAYLLLLGAISLIVGLASPLPQRRKFVLLLASFGVFSFAPFILAQDIAAYRRGLATELVLLLAVVSLFAFQSRRGVLKFVSVALCASFAVIKAPSEYQPLFGETFFGESCSVCQGSIVIRRLINDPLYTEVAKRPLRILLRGRSLPLFYGKCGALALESNEMKTLSPNASELVAETGTLAEAFAALKTGEIFVASCVNPRGNDAELNTICDGRSLFGKTLGMIPSSHEGLNMWWVLVEKI